MNACPVFFTQVHGLFQEIVSNRKGGVEPHKTLVPFLQVSLCLSKTFFFDRIAIPIRHFVAE